MENAQGWNIAYNAGVSAVVGGSISELSGGSFEEGALTAAMGRLFNDLSHLQKQFIRGTFIAGGAGAGAVGGAVTFGGGCGLATAGGGAVPCGYAGVALGGVAGAIAGGYLAEVYIGAVDGFDHWYSRSQPPGADPLAEGYPHSIIQQPGSEGTYTTHNGDGTWKQYRGSGKPHGNISRPNVKETITREGNDGRKYHGKIVRKPNADEIPGG